MKKKLLSLLLACVLILGLATPTYAATAPKITVAICMGEYVTLVWDAVEHDYDEYAIPLYRTI